MTKNWTCPQCGAEIVGELWQRQVCPRCLVGAAIEESPDDAMEPDDGESSTALEPPMVSQYRLVEWIGAGAMGVVYRGEDTDLHRPVALKFVTEGEHDEAEMHVRFLREARAVAALNHPNICTIYQVGEVESGVDLLYGPDGSLIVPGTRYIVMELIEGRTLAERLASGGPLGIDELLTTTLQIAEALAEAHARGIVHRDLKPGNVMTTQGGLVKILDFGLAQPTRALNLDRDDTSRIESIVELTRTGTIVGTMPYMSPEQLQGMPLGPRSDVFSFGVMTQELATGKRPFQGKSAAATIAKILETDPEPPSAARGDLPAKLDQIVGGCLNKSPDERPDADDLVISFRELQREVVTGAEAVPESITGRVTPRRQLFFGVIAVAAIAVAIGVWKWGAFSSTGPPSSIRPPSIAVLPLSNESPDPEESSHIAEGIGRAVVEKLSRVGLRVSPWETSSRYRNESRPAEEVGRELKVDHLLMGTFQHDDDQVRISLSLLDARNGSPLWLSDFEEPYENLFRLQQRIAVEVATTLKQELGDEERAVLESAVSSNLVAYDAYQLGAQYLQEGEKESIEVALRYFTQAAELDPGLAEAFVGIGAVHSDRYFYGWGGRRELAEARENYSRALELNPSLLRARRGLIRVAWERGESETCLEQGRQAAAVGRAGDVETLLTRAEAYIFGGIADRALLPLRRAIEIDPANQGAHWILTLAAWRAPDNEQCVETGEAYLRRFGPEPNVYAHMANSHMLLANLDLAEHHYERSLEFYNDSPQPGVLVDAGSLVRAIGQKKRAVQLWRRAVERVEIQLDATPDNDRARVHLVTALGLLGQQAELDEQNVYIRSDDDRANYMLQYLGFGYALLGDMERANEIFRECVRSGQVTIVSEWRVAWKRLAPHRESEIDEAFVRAYEATEQRLRALY